MVNVADAPWLLILLAALGLWLVVLFNQLTRARLAVREAWSAVDVQLQQRLDLVPNLVETVRGYARHERETLVEVVGARERLERARTPGAAAAANGALTAALGGLFALAEAYPNLRANENFRDLQEQLAETEDKVAYARNYYNSRALEYNTRRGSLPAVLAAGGMGFQAAEF